MTTRYWWSNHERRRALELRDNGLSYGGIARYVNRTPDAIAAHLRALRLQEETQP